MSGAVGKYTQTACAFRPVIWMEMAIVRGDFEYRIR